MIHSFELKLTNPSRSHSYIFGQEPKVKAMSFISSCTRYYCWKVYFMIRFRVGYFCITELMYEISYAYLYSEPDPISPETCILQALFMKKRTMGK